MIINDSLSARPSSQALTGNRRAATTWNIRLKPSLYIVIGVFLGASILLGAQVLQGFADSRIAHTPEFAPVAPHGQEGVSDGPGMPLSENDLGAADMQPTKHARSAGVLACLANIDAVTRLSVSGAYTAVSTWNQLAPNERLFNSIIGQITDNKNAPKAISVVVTAPTRQDQCDATAVEVRPSGLSCSDLQRTLAQNHFGTRARIAGTPVLEIDPRLRYLLLPAMGEGCVVVAVRTLYGN